MTKTNTRGVLKTLIVVLTATMMLSAATCCYIRADFGSDSVAVLQQGLSIFTGLSLGNAAFAFSGALLVIDFFVARKNISWTSVVNCLLCGVFIDVANWALAPVFGLSDGLWFRVILFAAGLLLVSMSCALLITYNKGMSVQDALVCWIAEKLHLSYRAVRITMDALYMFAGWLMGGVVGAGSIAAVFGTGPLIQWMLRFGKKS